ncbi:MAG: glycerol-3-phosphate dehydrogenase [Methyloligellaceae bacterium]
MSQMFDIVIVGGGINGVGIARDAAGRGLSVFLAEKGDLASGTSSAATKLIHGGLRYLEQYEFSLVREALSEREVLWRLAPHIIHPLRFILPHHRGLRPTMLIRLGLFLYDYIGGRRKLPGSKAINLKQHEAGKVLKKEFEKGFEYSDCWVDDARLVVLNALDAQNNGAEIHVGTEVVSARKEEDCWRIKLKNCSGEELSDVRGRILINAAGPWAGSFLNGAVGSNSKGQVRLVKGSHIVVKKLFDHDKAYIFQNDDQRIIFAIPYEGDYTLIGTTDVEYVGEPGDVKISQDEIEYLCSAASEYFEEEVVPERVHWSYSGVRPLYDDGDANPQEVTRDFVLDVDGKKGEPVLLNIFGGKLTTYRYLAEKALEKLSPWISVSGPKWTHSKILPGGDMPMEGFDDFTSKLKEKYSLLESGLVERLARLYGTRVNRILSDVISMKDMGKHFGADLYEREVEYLRKEEWARTADDILWRRTKLGLRFNNQEKSMLIEWLDKHKL